MRDRDRAARANLLAEQRHDAAGGAEHVAEAHRSRSASSISRAKFWQKISATRLHAPMTLVGLTALSVEISTKLPTPWRSAASATTFGAEHVVAERLRAVASPSAARACTRRRGTRLAAARARTTRSHTRDVAAVAEHGIDQHDPGIRARSSCSMRYRLNSDIRARSAIRRRAARSAGTVPRRSSRRRP